MSTVEEKIRKRAYELWEHAGCPEGRSWEFWFFARSEAEGQTSAAGQETGDRPVDAQGVGESAGAVPEAQTRVGAEPKARRA